MVGELSDRAFFVRHPIFTPQRKLAAFHLRLIGRVPGRVEVPEHKLASCLEEITELFHAVRWNRISQGKRLLIPLTPPLLTDDILRTLPPRRTAVALDWRLIQDLDWANYLKKIHLFHLDLALSHYDLSEPLPLDEYPIEHVAVDIHAAGPQRIMQALPPQRDRTHWIACRVNTQKQFAVCSYYGFHWLEGRFYLRHPEVSESEGGVKPSQVKVFQLLSRVDDARLNLEEVALILEQDVALSEQVVELVNATTLREGDEPIHSILDAVRRLGVKQLKSWLHTIVVSEMGRKVPEVVRAALVRAAFLRCMGRSDPMISEDTYYTVGMFSLLDVMLNRPMVDILKTLNLSDAIMEAILDYEGRPGAALRVIEALEADDGQDDMTLSLPRGVVPAQVNSCYLKALEYADMVMTSIRF